jgi:CRISPR type III-A-associated RAMP protein Csm4
VDRIGHSDTFYAAVCSAMFHLGRLEEWLTERSVRLSSLFPYHGDMLFATPPRNIWPPPTSGRVRWDAARFVPIHMIETLIAGKSIEEDRWVFDGPSLCLVPSGGKYRGRGPVRIGERSAAAVDRTGAGVEVHRTACLEFAEEAGMWGVIGFDSREVKHKWEGSLRAAMRLLADSGIGGERSRGWGRSAPPRITDGRLPELLFRYPPLPPQETAYWLLSVCSPAEDDAIDWSRGSYGVTLRTGRVESAGRPLGRSLRVIEEGSVLVGERQPRGAIHEVTPEGVAHPVLRCGLALAIPLPWRKPAPGWMAAEAVAAEPPAAAVVVEPEEAVPEGEEPPVEPPPAEKPPAEEPPPPEAPVEIPPPQEPPVEEPTMPEPPVEEPPAKEPSIQEPPPEESRMDALSVEEPPVTEGPAEEPAIEQPRSEEPPVDALSVEEPPVAEGPAEEPAVDEGSMPPTEETPDVHSENGAEEKSVSIEEHERPPE